MLELLIATTDRDVVSGLCESLGQEGTRFHFADTTADCFQTAAEMGSTLSIALISSNLPGGGPLEACTTLNQMGIPVLVIATPEQVDAAYAAGADDVLTWPQHPTINARRVQGILETRDLRAQTKRDNWYHSMVDNSVAGIFRTSLSGQVLFVNNRLAIMMGYDSELDLMKLSIADIYLNPQDRANLLREALNADDYVQWEGMLKRKDGTPIPVTITIRTIQSESGRVIFLEGFVIDNSKRYRAEQAEQSEHQFAETLREAAAVINSNLNLDEVLDRIMDMLNRVMPLDVVNILLIEDGIARSVRSHGYEQHGIAEEIKQIALPVQDIPNMREMMTTRQPLVIPDTRQYPGWVTIPEIQWIRSNAMAPITTDNHLIGFLDVNSITPNTFNKSHGERLQAFANQAAIAIENARLYEAVQQHNRELEAHVTERTAELEQKRAELVAILNSIQEGVVGSIFIPGTKVVAERHINTTVVKMFGYSEDEWDVRKLRPDDIAPEEFDRLLQYGRDTANQEGEYHTIQKAQHKNGTVFEVSITGTSIRTNDGEPIGRVTVYRDVSKERELEARQARFVAAAAHELRNPLTAFKTRLDLAQRKPQDMERHLQLLRDTSNRMERLVTDLLNQNRFERGVIEIHPAPVELQPLLGKIQELLAPEAELKQITLQTDLPPEPLVVMGDADRLHQVVTNLAVNAIAYSPERSTVTLHLCHADDGQALIQVEDTGTGIAPEHLPHLFEPFYRIRKIGQGMGLGLSITREIVELHGGTISADSEIGRGTCFNVRLPVAPQ
jgi:PAS domain S-box-containing protein